MQARPRAAGCTLFVSSGVFTAGCSEHRGVHVGRHMGCSYGVFSGVFSGMFSGTVVSRREGEKARSQKPRSREDEKPNTCSPSYRIHSPFDSTKVYKILQNSTKNVKRLVPLFVLIKPRARPTAETHKCCAHRVAC